MRKSIVIILALFLSITFSFSQSSGKKEVKADLKHFQKEGSNFDWKAFDTTSKISIDSIKPEIMQGLWKAYNGFFKFGDLVNSMDLTTPFTIEITSGKLRRNSNSEFESFSLNKNYLIPGNGKDKGYINKITGTLLIITWQNDGNNYIRYYYEKQ